jgi:UDP-glucose 4-epimerase
MTGRVLVTGASGFIGRDLVTRLAGSGWQVRAAARNVSGLPAREGIEPAELGDLAGGMDWSRLVAGITHVVHLAGIAHSTATADESLYMAVNARAVEALGRAARTEGVERVVMVSSVRAQCGPTAAGVVDETRKPEPVDAYGRSKLEGEWRLEAALAGSATSWCALRPVLCYGPGVKGNMRSLLRLARSALPLPLATLPGRRSLLGTSNLQIAAEHALRSTSIARRAYLLADPGPLTVGEIVGAMRRGMGRQARVFGLPLQPVQLAAIAAGKADAWQRLAGDLVVSTAALEATGWVARETAAEGLTRWMEQDSG